MDQSAPSVAETDIVGLVIKDFARLAVADQARVKEQLQGALESSLAPLAAADRIVLDVPAGLAVIVLAGPEYALATAEGVQELGAELPLCVALNHGPVKILGEAGRPAEFVGDGIIEALTLAQLATRGKILVSRAFREALARSAPHQARAVSPLGSFTDDNVRKHELFTLDARAAGARRRAFTMVAALIVLAGVGSGYAARTALQAAKRPAVIWFDVKPRGDIFIDGEMKGTTPPLSSLQVAPGRHTVELRHGSHPPMKMEVRLKPAEEIRVTHAFTGSKGQRRGREGDSVWDDVRRRLGI